VASRGVPTEIAHLGGQFPESVYEIRESQNDNGTGRDYAGDYCGVGHIVTSNTLIVPSRIRLFAPAVAGDMVSA
jgi:hypothetical protein